MTGTSCQPLIDLLHAPSPDLNRIIPAFVSCFNTAYGDPVSDRWDITLEEWQRYEFLGDRVLNLIIAQSLFTQRHAVLTEGEMTRISSGIVSNRALDMLIREHAEPAVFSRLIPPVIGEQKTYGERITGGAFEALVGVLYCELGLDDVVFFITAILKEPLRKFNPEENAIGMLQEFIQKKYRSIPTYRETKRTGPDHRPLFTFEVLFGHEVLGEGTGESIQQAEQSAARAACRKLGISMPPAPDADTL